MKKWKWVLVCLLLLTLSVPVAVSADTTDSDDPDQPADVEQPEGGDDETDDDNAEEDPAGDDMEEPADDDFADQQPSYQNAAQAMHAANLAAAIGPDEDTLKAADNVTSARETYDEAQAALDKNPDDMDLQEAVELAEGELQKAREEYAEAIGDLAGVRSQEISDLRQSGMGWGRIAHELGVHPGALGLARGKYKGVIDPVDGTSLDEDVAAAGSTAQSEIAEATQRDKKNGWSRGHGLKTDKTNSSQKGLGLSETSMAATSNGGSKSSKSKGASSGGTTASGKSNNGRGKDGGPSSSSNQGKGSGKSGNAKQKSDKSNNGKGNGKNK